MSTVVELCRSHCGTARSVRNTGPAAQNGALSFILVPLHVTSPSDQTANVCMAYVEVSYSPGIEVALLRAATAMCLVTPIVVRCSRYHHTVRWALNHRASLQVAYIS